MELSSQETSRASDLEDPPAWWVASASPDHPGDDAGLSWDAAAGPPADKNALEGWPDESWDPNMKFCSLDISASTKPSADSFLEKLWEILSSQSFESIWWGNDGNCVVIGEKLFRKEVLGRRGPRKIFETESMRGFLLQLMFHGFRRMEGDSPLLTSMEELRAVAAAGSALGKLLFYSNPFFTRDDLPCVWQGEQGVGESTNPLAVSPAGTGIQAQLPRRRWDAEPAAGADEEEDEDTQTATSSSSTVPGPRADTAPRPGSAGPSPHKRPCRRGPAGTREAAPAPATAPLPHATPPAPRWPLTLPGLPTLRPGQPNPGAGQAPGAALPPACPPWFAMATLGPGPAPGHPPAHGHCPTCTCTANPAGPRPELGWEEQGPLGALGSQR